MFRGTTYRLAVAAVGVLASIFVTAALGAPTASAADRDPGSASSSASVQASAHPCPHDRGDDSGENPGKRCSNTPTPPGHNKSPSTTPNVQPSTTASPKPTHTPRPTHTPQPTASDSNPPATTPPPASPAVVIESPVEASASTPSLQVAPIDTVALPRSTGEQGVVAPETTAPQPTPTPAVNPPSDLRAVSFAGRSDRPMLGIDSPLLIAGEIGVFAAAVGAMVASAGHRGRRIH